MKPRLSEDVGAGLADHSDVESVKSAASERALEPVADVQVGKCLNTL